MRMWVGLGWVALGVLLSSCSGQGRVEDRRGAMGEAAAWYEVVSRTPGPEVTDAAMRGRIEQTGKPWKVRDRATGIEMVLVMPGEFLMGSPEDEAGRRADEGPRHRVRLTKAFYMGVTEVTQGQWERLMGPTRSFFKGESLPIDPSWSDVQAFLSKANEGSPAGRELMRLPTEAEWEYACRAGTTGRFGFDEEIGLDVVNFNDGEVKHAVVLDGKLEVEWVRRPSPECPMATVPAGSLPPNAWGLHEMHGNLWEWCADKYTREGYAVRGEVAVDPFVRPEADELLALRGGSWYDRADLCRAAVRDGGGPMVRSNRIGLRVVRTD